HGGNDAAKGARHVDRRQDARADVPRTVPGARAHGKGRPELSLRPGSVEPGCLTCAVLHARCKAALGGRLLFRIVGASTAPASMALPWRRRSRPQHQKLTHTPQQRASLFDHLVSEREQFVCNLQVERAAADKFFPKEVTQK